MRTSLAWFALAALVTTTACSPSEEPASTETSSQVRVEASIESESAASDSGQVEGRRSEPVSTDAAETGQASPASTGPQSECIDAAAKGGGYALGSDHSIHDDVPNENVLAIFEAGRKYGKYPTGEVGK